jgi:hypothetical protein
MAINTADRPEADDLRAPIVPCDLLIWIKTLDASLWKGRSVVDCGAMQKRETGVISAFGVRGLAIASTASIALALPAIAQRGPQFALRSTSSTVR